MKKLLAILLVLVFVFSLSGCGSNENSKSNKDQECIDKINAAVTFNDFTSICTVAEYEQLDQETKDLFTERLIGFVNNKIVNHKYYQTVINSYVLYYEGDLYKVDEELYDAYGNPTDKTNDFTGYMDKVIAASDLYEGKPSIDIYLKHESNDPKKNYTINYLENEELAVFHRHKLPCFSYEDAYNYWLYGDDYKEKVKKAKEEEELAHSDPKIGMTVEEVLKCAWGKPDHINKDTYSWGTQEQWCYSNNRYVYFENGIVTSISDSY